MVNFNKAMIDLVREIRRRAPADAKPGIKLANPDLLTEMIPWYRSSNDSVAKALLKELYTLAGDDWLEQLQESKPAAEAAPAAGGTIEKDGKRYVTKVYRGQTQLVEVPMPPAESAATQKIYRGQVVRA
ncbi:hypothetical protein [Pseudomaricurvus sp. HS19]|uniref:hypothetical protein n=1 Tax=Pseudomaricurvus sp. HS19 TaxID=2692626 RepID=UPI0013706F6D|nr:hypothetical protein [Pseudomaricurvus sp. HS19]MYM64559.1 hypothetical protein [Pseudomaricurvus sp. HS19]